MNYQETANANLVRRPAYRLSLNQSGRIVSSLLPFIRPLGIMITPRRLRWALVTLAATISLAGNPRHAADAATVYDNVSFGADGAAFGAFSDRDYLYAQEFIAGESGAVSEVHIALVRIGEPAGEAHIEVWSADGSGEPNSPLGRLGSISHGDLEELTPQPGIVPASGLISGLSPGQPYFVVVDLTELQHDGQDLNFFWNTRAGADGVNGASHLMGDNGFGWQTASDVSGSIVNYALMSVIEPTLGDFNFDGSVNGVDLLAWQRGESPDPLSAADLAKWQSSFGENGSLAGVQSAAVPEPNSLVLAVLFAVAGVAGAGRR